MMLTNHKVLLDVLVSTNTLYTADVLGISENVSSNDKNGSLGIDVAALQRRRQCPEFSVWVAINLKLTEEFYDKIQSLGYDALAYEVDVIHKALSQIRDYGLDISRSHV